MAKKDNIYTFHSYNTGTVYFKTFKEAVDAMVLFQKQITPRDFEAKISECNKHTPEWDDLGYEIQRAVEYDMNVWIKNKDKIANLYSSYKEDSSLQEEFSSFEDYYKSLKES